MSKIIEKIKKWWRKHICSPVPPGQEDMFDEWNPKDQNGKYKGKY